MADKHIRVGICLTINRGNYESVRPMIELDDVVGDTETFSEAHERLSTECEELWMKEYERHLALLKKGHQT
jgi:hypothetical protein